MSKARLFLGVSIPDDITKKIFKALEPARENIHFPIRFVPDTKLHITLSFLGEQNRDDIRSIVNAMSHTVSRFDAPRIVFTDISYGPKNRGEHIYTPRMIWLNGSDETSESLSAIKEDFENQLLDEGLRFSREYRKFNCHITLARFRAEFKHELPDLMIPFEAEFEATDLQLLESHLKRSGAEYDVIENFEFKN